MAGIPGHGGVMKTVVAFDADGVLYDFLGGLKRRLEDKFGYNLDIPSVRTYSLYGLTGNDDIDHDISEAIHDPRFYFGLKPMPHAVEAIGRLAADDDFTLVVITARPSQCMQATRVAIERDFGPVFPEVTLCKSDRKPRLAKKLHHARIAFEDNANTAVAYAQAGIRTYLVRHPYNAESRLHSRIVPVGDLGEAVDHILSQNTMEEAS